MELLTLSAMKKGPIVVNYHLVPSINFRSTITGTNRDNVTVQVFYVNSPMWSGTLGQNQQHLKIAPLHMGDFQITDGTLALTVPTDSTDGNVMLSCKITQQGQDPIDFSSPIANWPLTSDAT
jgi:hypothetical protein